MAYYCSSLNNTKAIKTTIFLRDPQMHLYPLSKFATQELGGGGGGGVFTHPHWVKVWVKNTLCERGLRSFKYFYNIVTLHNPIWMLVAMENA